MEEEDILNQFNNSISSYTSSNESNYEDSNSSLSDTDENEEYAELNLNMEGFFEELDNIIKTDTKERNYDLLREFINTNNNYLNIRSEGRSAFIYAVLESDFNLMEFLLANGADVNDRYVDPNMKYEHDNYSALHIAVKMRQPDMVEFLLENNVDPDITDYGVDNSPIFYAQDINLIGMLVRRGANINFCNGDNENLLTYNMRIENEDDFNIDDSFLSEELIATLLQNGFNQISESLGLAIKYSRNDVIKILLPSCSNIQIREVLSEFTSKITTEKAFDVVLQFIKSHNLHDDLKLFLLNSFSLNFDQSNEAGGIKSICDMALSEIRLLPSLEFEQKDLIIDFDVMLSNGDTPLLYLVRTLEQNKFQSLQQVIINAIKSAKIDIKNLNSEYEGNSLLDYAIKFEQVELVKKLTSVGVNVNGNHLADSVTKSIELNDIKILEALIDSGQNIDLNQPNKDGISPLFSVVSSSCIEEQQIRLKIAESLLLKGVDKNKSTTYDLDYGELSPIKYINDRLNDSNEENKEFYKKLSKIVGNCSSDDYGIVDYFCDFNQDQNVEQDLPEQGLLGNKRSSEGMIEFSDDEL